jgi:hypothetical protein
MNALPGIGSVRVVSKRADKAAIKADPDEDVIRCHRGSGRIYPIFGNYAAEGWTPRAEAIEAYRKMFEKDVAQQGSLHRECVKIAKRVMDGERIALECWCAPLRCHADIICAHIKSIINEAETKKE